LQNSNSLKAVVVSELHMAWSVSEPVTIKTQNNVPMLKSSLVYMFGVVFLTGL